MQHYLGISQNAQRNASVTSILWSYLIHKEFDKFNTITLDIELNIGAPF